MTGTGKAAPVAPPGAAPGAPDAPDAPDAPLDAALPLASMSADEVASEVARRLWAAERASKSLGMELLEVRSGFARMRMTIRADMTNGHGMCHGGFMFMLADSAFAFACNSHNQRNVAASAEIHFVAPAREGDVLHAEARELHLGGRSGVYDMRVTDQDGRLVALFRGKSATIQGRFIEDSQAASDAGPHAGPNAGPSAGPHAPAGRERPRGG